jgi:LPS-assembly lipoprotein
VNSAADTQRCARPARRVARVLGLAALLLLTGCGFHLRGRELLPRSLAQLQIEAVDAQSDFTHALRAQLRAAGVQLEGVASGRGPAATASGAATVAGAANGAVRVRILADSTAERVLTVSARNIPTAYELSYRVKVSVESGGRELMAPEEHTLTREYSFDERAMLAKQRERDALYQALAEDLATLYLRRFATL